jgi:hypothetical protein
MSLWWLECAHKKSWVLAVPLVSLSLGLAWPGGACLNAMNFLASKVPISGYRVCNTSCQSDARFWQGYVSQSLDFKNTHVHPTHKCSAFAGSG